MRSISLMVGRILASGFAASLVSLIHLTLSGYHYWITTPELIITFFIFWIIAYFVICVYDWVCKKPTPDSQDGTLRGIGIFLICSIIIFTCLVMEIPTIQKDNYLSPTYESYPIQYHPIVDFVKDFQSKNYTRNFTNPIPDLSTFITLVQTVMDTNPWNCTAYSIDGIEKPAIEKIEWYSGKVVYEDAEAQTVGIITVESQTAAAFHVDIMTILGTIALGTAMGGTPSHDSSEDSFNTMLKCHASTGELYTVIFKRDNMTVSIYEDEAIVTEIENWADVIPILT